MTDDYTFIFNRLAIIDLTDRENQPFETDRSVVMCNGEIYNYKELKQRFSDFDYTSDSDCETLVPMFENLGPEMCKNLDAEFACVIYNK